MGRVALLVAMFVVTTALTRSHAIGLGVGVMALILFFALWLGLPRRERDRHP